MELEACGWLVAGVRMANCWRQAGRTSQPRPTALDAADGKPLRKSLRALLARENLRGDREGPMSDASGRRRAPRGGNGLTARGTGAGTGGSSAARSLNCSEDSGYVR